MEAYTGFAEVYDCFMDNIPYEEWAKYVIELLEENGVHTGLNNSSIVDLGCGTGTFTQMLSNYGFQMIGIDNSEDMLSIATNKMDNENKTNPIIYTLQDMRDFVVPEAVTAIVSVCDSLNYIIDKEELIEVFSCVKNALDENGVFIFDLKTIHFFQDILGESTIAENREDCAFIWDNYYYEEEAVNEYELAIFIQEENNLFRKYEEIHFQRGYTIDEVKECIEKVGLRLDNVYEAFSHTEPNETSERLYFVVKVQ